MFSILSKIEVSKLVERTIDAAFHVDSDRLILSSDGDRTLLFIEYLMHAPHTAYSMLDSASNPLTVRTRPAVRLVPPF